RRPPRRPPRLAWQFLNSRSVSVLSGISLCALCFSFWGYPPSVENGGKESVAAQARHAHQPGFVSAPGSGLSCAFCFIWIYLCSSVVPRFHGPCRSTSSTHRHSSAPDRRRRDTSTPDHKSANSYSNSADPLTSPT